MCLAGEAGAVAPDTYLSERTRRVFDWYAHGVVTEVEALHLLGQACLGWAELNRYPGGIEIGQDMPVQGRC